MCLMNPIFNHMKSYKCEKVATLQLPVLWYKVFGFFYYFKHFRISVF